MRAPRIALCLALAFAPGACAGDDEERADDTLAADHVATALDSSSELSRLVVPLEVSGNLGPDAILARQRKVMEAAAAFDALDGIRDCVDVATDNATYVDVTFRSCLIAFLTFDGRLRADVAIDPPVGLPSRVVVTVTLTDLTLTGPLRSRRLDGEVVLRHAILPLGSPVELEGELQVAPDGGPALTASLGAAWTVNDGCVTLTGGAQLSGAPLGELGPIVLSGERIQGCRNQCPTSGSVELSYGAGKLLGWTYTGADVATVIGPRGKRVEVALPCGGS
jgi:hypothetical protein